MDLQKILNIFEEHGFNENNCSFFRQEDITDIAKEIKAAINYTHCSTQLKDKKTITFDEFAKENNYKQNFLYFYRDGKTFKPSEIMKRYKTYLLNL
jgi:predicted transcriptional regulator